MDLATFCPTFLLMLWLHAQLQTDWCSGRLSSLYEQAKSSDNVINPEEIESICTLLNMICKGEVHTTSVEALYWLSRRMLYSRLKSAQWRYQLVLNTSIRLSVAVYVQLRSDVLSFSGIRALVAGLWSVNIWQAVVAWVGRFDGRFDLQQYGHANCWIFSFSSSLQASGTCTHFCSCQECMRNWCSTSRLKWQWRSRALPSWLGVTVPRPLLFLSTCIFSISMHVQ